jgi:transposase
MLRSFQYRLYPSKRQQRLLDQQWEECRWLYHHLLAARREAWDQRQESLRYYDPATTRPPACPRAKPSGPCWQPYRRRWRRMSPSALIWRFTPSLGA